MSGDGSQFIVGEYRVPASGANGIDFTVTLDGNGDYDCNCWLNDPHCPHIREVDAGMWHSEDPLVRAVDLGRRLARNLERSSS